MDLKIGDKLKPNYGHGQTCMKWGCSCLIEVLQVFPNAAKVKHVNTGYVRFLNREFMNNNYEKV